MERLAFGLFALGLGLLSYFYGVASTKFELFPFEYVRDAWSGVRRCTKFGPMSSIECRLEP